jgi:hypothetical protein
LRTLAEPGNYAGGEILGTPVTFRECRLSPSISKGERTMDARWATAKVLVLAAALLACKRGEEATNKGDTPAATVVKRLDHPAGEAGLKALLTSSFASSSAKPAEVVGALRPDPADYASVFEADAASKVKDNTEKMLGSPPSELGKDGDEVQVWPVTSDELKSGAESANNCPGGYARVASQFKTGTTLYCAKVGSVSYDIFAHVGGHWVWFPKAFRALRE